jgi:GrpB-like predicted nucleotidyltransferase (UPF0157 family)
MELDENIFIVKYDPSWPLLFNKEAANIQEAIIFNDVHIEHIGSTSVKGLCAKPIVDIQLGIHSWEYLDDIKTALIVLGYEYFGEAGVAGRHYFRKRSDHAFNVHVVLWNNDIWNNNLLIREYLINNKEAADRYCSLKKETIKKGINMLLAYSDHKEDFIKELLETARTWRKI